MTGSDQILLEVIIQHIIIMQYPVVLMLGILGLQARKVFRERAFLFIAIGWLFNLAYLLVRNYPNINSLVLRNRDSALSDLATPFVFISSTAFLLAARAYPRPTRNPLLARWISDRLVIAIFAVTLLFVLITSAYLPSAKKYPLLLIPGIPDVVVDVIALTALAIFYKQFSMEHSLSRTNKSLYYGSLLYAAIQPVYFLAVGTPQAVKAGAEVSGFFLGLASKMIILFGLLKLFGDSAIKARQEEARVEETRRTVGRIAHELGTPVAQMNVYVNLLLQESSLRGKLHQSILSLDFSLHRVEAIMEASRDLHLLEQFVRHPNLPMDVSHNRIEQVHSLNKLVQTALMAVKETRDENAVYSIRYSGNCCLSCVSFEVIQVMINIFRNALDALPAGEGRVTVETNNIEVQGTSAVQVIVQDTGEGISPKIEPHIFEEGFSTRGGPGRGFGLFVTKRLVELNHGKIAITNNSDPKGEASLGSRVTLEFPRVPCKKRKERQGGYR